MSETSQIEQKPALISQEVTAAVDVSNNKIGIALLNLNTKCLYFLESDYAMNKLDKNDECLSILGYLIESYGLNMITFSSRVDEVVVNEIEVKLRNKLPREGYNVDMVSLKSFTNKNVSKVICESMMKKSVESFDNMYDDVAREDESKYSLFVSLIEGRESSSKLTFGCVNCLIHRENKPTSNETLSNNSDTTVGNQTQAGDECNETAINHTIDTLIINFEHLPLNDQSFTMDDDTIFSLQILPNSLSVYQKAGTKPNAVYSLVDLLGQKMQTDLGRDTLIKWVLNPIKNVDLIKTRHDFIELALTHYDNFSMICSMINKLPNINKIMYDFQEGKITLKNWIKLQQYLNQLLEIEIFLKQLEVEFGNFFNPYLTEFIKVLETLRLTNLIDSIITFFNSEESVAEQKIVIQKGFNSELDSFIETYDSLNVILAEKAEILNSQLAQVFNAPFNVAVMYAPQLGFLVSVKKSVYRKYLTGNGTGFDFIFDTKTHVFLKNKMMEELDNTHGDIYSVISDMEMELQLNFQNEIFNLYNSNLSKSYKLATEIEVLLSFTHLSYTNNYSRPIFNLQNNHNNKKVLTLTKARHPIYETINESHISNDYTSWDAESSEHKNVAVITGANMSGKTIYMLTIGLNVLLAQIGCFVACERMELSPVDIILTKINTRESLSKLNSNFVLDCQQMNKCLKKTTEHSLVLIDEFGKGTNVIDGPSLFGGVLFHLIEAKCRAVLCTHFHELFSDDVLGKDQMIQRNINFYMTDIVVGENREFITFLYKLKRGISFKSFGVICAKYCNVNDQVVSDASFISDLMVSSDQSKNEKMTNLFQFLSNTNESALNEEYQQYKTLMIDFLKKEF